MVIMRHLLLGEPNGWSGFPDFQAYMKEMVFKCKDTYYQFHDLKTSYLMSEC